MSASLPHPFATRALATNAALGVLAAALLFALGGSASDPISVALVTGVGAVVPLGILALRRSGPPALLVILSAAIPIAGACAIVALVEPAGRTAGLWAATWMPACLLCASAGAGRLVRGLRDPAELCAGAALVYLPVGAFWLIASRMGYRPLGFDAVVVALTAIHFHFAAFAAPILASRTIDAVVGRWRTAASIAGLGVVIAQPIVAAGITVSAPLALAGAVLLACSLLTLSVVILAKGLRVVRSPLARILIGTSALVPFFSMPLAVLWSLAEAGGPRVLGLEDMVRWHGTANAYGLALLGLLGWALHAATGGERAALDCGSDPRG